MLSVWWTVEGVQYWELFPEKKTVTTVLYRAQLNRLIAEIKNKDRMNGIYYFQHDNARPHIAKVVEAKLDEFGLKVVPDPPYSCDLAPSDYHLFCSMSNTLKKKNFKDKTELKKFIQEIFKTFSSPSFLPFA